MVQRPRGRWSTTTATAPASFSAGGGPPERQAPAARAGTPSRPGWRLGRRARRGVLVVHIVAAGAWIGIDVVLAVLVYTALWGGDTRSAALSYQALELFAVWPLLTAGLVCLAAGVTLGLGTGYGLLRYWWVAVKLAINVVFVALVPVALHPLVLGAAAYGRHLAGAGGPVDFRAFVLLFPVTVSPAGLLTAVVLSVYKPWGRLRQRGHPSPSAAGRGVDK